MIRYYIEDKTMEDIARELGVSRSSVSRMLKQARELGLVRISVSSRPNDQSVISSILGEAFGVQTHLVPLPASTSNLDRLDRVSRVAAQILTESMQPGHVLGVAWGETMAQVAKHLGRQPLVDCLVVQVNGGSNSHNSGLSYVGDILQRIAWAFGGKVVLFPVPAFFDHDDTKEAMWRESSVRRILELRERMDALVFGVGCLTSTVPSYMYASGYFELVQLKEIASRGVVGDVCGVLLREDGTWRGIPYNTRATGLTPDEMKKTPRRICVAADASRAPAIVAALRAGAATDIIIDDATARAVIEKARLSLKADSWLDSMHHDIRVREH